MIQQINLLIYDTGYGRNGIFPNLRVLEKNPKFSIWYFTIALGISQKTVLIQHDGFSLHLHVKEHAQEML